MENNMNMLDYIEAETFVSEDKPFLEHLERQPKTKYGYDYYWLNGCAKMQIKYNESTGHLVLFGSIPYYWQNHNFTFTKTGFVDAINHIGGLLHFNLWNMFVTIFEYGVIVEVGREPKQYIAHHREGKGMYFDIPAKDIPKGTIKFFNDKLVQRKMYDAGRNIMKKCGRNKDIIKEQGFNPEAFYLKWEAHYLKPAVVFNGGLTLANLVNPKYESAFKEDLYSQYTKLIPMKNLIEPTQKSDLSTSDLLAIELVESKLNEGATIDEIKKMLYARINASLVLSKSDKDARKRQVKTIIDKLQLSEVSEWDLSQQLQQAIFGEEPGTSSQQEDNSEES